MCNTVMSGYMRFHQKRNLIVFLRLEIWGFELGFLDGAKLSLICSECITSVAKINHLVMRVILHYLH